MPEEAPSSPGIEKLSIRCGSVFGIPIRLHVLLPLTCVLAGVSSVLSGLPWLSVLLAVLVAGPLLLVTVLIHELGHVLAARRCGCATDHILLWPLGGLAFIGGSTGPKEQMLIAGSGPATHLPMLGAWSLPLALMGRLTLSTHGLYYDLDFFALVCIAMLNTNLVMMCFNLLVPCFPLDCSRILASLLLLRGFEPGQAAQVIIICSGVALVAVVVLSVWSYMHNHASASMNLVLAAWLAVQTWRLHRSRLQGNLASNPLFSSAMAGDAAQASRAPPQAQSRFRPFEGGATSLGKATAPAGQVCIGAAIALWMALEVSRAGPCPAVSQE
mmetsp:Transcript_36717/g.84728  ORF Transcript_36717/g.84728 Transcript_36717/m.84728 type:complete len:328 (+) Transcript_36717:54-1037(+)